MLSAVGIIDLAATLYSPITNLTELTRDSTKAMLYGGLEMTTGCSEGALLDIAVSQKLSVIASIIAFGGLSIHMQTKAVCRASGLEPKDFLLAKSLQAFLAYILCMLSLAIFPLTVAVSGINTNIKTTAYYGIVFAAASIIILIVIKLYQKKQTAKSALTFTRKL